MAGMALPSESGGGLVEGRDWRRGDLAPVDQSTSGRDVRLARRLALGLEARNHHAIARVAIITATPTARKTATASYRISFSDRPLGPAGSSTPARHVAGAATRAKAIPATSERLRADVRLPK